MSDELEVANPTFEDTGDAGDDDTGLRNRKLGDVGKTESDDDGMKSGDMYQSDIRSTSHVALTLAYYSLGIVSQAVVYTCLWIQYRSEGGIAEKHTSERGDIEYMNDYNYWLLMIATLGLASQLSQLPKHIDPARNTLFQELSILQEKVSNVLGANPVPQLEDAMKVNFDQAALTNLSWHARMVFAPMWNTLLAGVLYSLVGIQTLEHFASTIGSEECTESVMGVLLMMPASVFETMWIGMAGFILAAVFNLRLSLTHFEALTNGYVAFFRGTPSVKMLKLAMEKAGRGAQTFSNDRMRLAYLTNLTVQILLLLIINYVVSESKDGEGLDLVGSLIFGILVFERFLVGFQMALLAAYVRHSVELDDDSDDVGLLEIKKRERISWHSSMIFYTGFLAVLQSLICLPGIFTVIPFFSVAEVGDDGSFIDCSRLDMSLGAKISGATSDELQFFFICLLCMFVAFACQIWLTRTHFVQFWRYEKDVVFTHSVEEDEEEEDKAKRSAKQEIWRQQRLLMVRIGRMRATQLGDDEVITRLIDHFALTAQAPGQGLTEMDVRIAVSSQLEEVFRDWKEKFEADTASGTTALASLKAEQAGEAAAGGGDADDDGGGGGDNGVAPGMTQSNMSTSGDYA